MSDPRDKVHDIDIPGRTRWALRIRGIDDTGNHRVLALDWDGVWHPLDPVTGADARIGVLIHFCDLRPGEVAFSERSGDHWPYAARIGEKFTWTRQGHEHRLSPLDVWDGAADHVRIFAVGANESTLRQIIDQHAEVLRGR